MMNLPKVVGEPITGTLPKSARWAFNFGVARPALISVLSLSTTCVGVFLGAPMPHHELTSYPGTNSLTVGRSGNVSDRVIVDTASGRTLLALMYSREVGRLSNMTCTCPASKSVSAGAATG